MTPDELLGVAEQLLSIPERRLGTTRFLAASLLLRQALEEALDGFWASKVPGMEEVSTRAQLVSLPFYLSDRALAGTVALAWHRLSAACHHHAYDLPPPLTELRDLAGTVKRLVHAVP
jgi:hypothetical protein